ncbi:MAG: Mur ligase family protein [Candidatus Altimarinota bacterium]
MIPFLSILWLLRTAAALSQSTYYWQLKEYRWDRMKEFLFQQGGKNFFINTFHLLALVLVFVYGAFWVFDLPGEEGFLQWFPLVVAVLFLAEVLQDFHTVLLRKFRRPRPTAKALMIFSSTFLIELACLALFWWSMSGDPTIDAIAFFLLFFVAVEHDIHAAVVGVFNRMSRFAKRRIFHQAQAKRLGMKELKVIGITGSYGKSSVKEYLSHILAEDFRVLKTQKNTNTEIGIAQTILKDLKEDHEVFVCEMGAYSRGEIGLCCQIAVPQIGVFTGLNDQHAALFGSIDHTFQAKWELIQALPKDGLAVFNGDSAELKSRLKPSEVRSVVCSTVHGDAVAQDIKVHQDSIEFRYKGRVFTASLLGSFQVVNLLMCIVVAESLGLSLERIAQRISSLAAPDKTMTLLTFSRGYIIDDSYNVNSDGLQEALTHLQRFEGYHRVLFFPGILELGEASPSLHERFGELISHHVDDVFFTDSSFSQYLTAGALKGGLGRSHIFEVQDQQEMIHSLQKLLEGRSQERFVILFESRGAEKVMEWLGRGE